MGRARTGSRRPRRGDASAIPPQASARPDRRRSRRGSALALVGARGIAAGPLAARSRMPWRAPDYSHKWETLRPAERRLSGIRLAELPDPAAEAQAIALALARGAGNAGQDRRAGHARPAARRPRFGAAAALGNPGRRQRRQAPVADGRRAPCCWRLPRRRGRSGAGVAARAAQASAGRRRGRRARRVARACPRARPRSARPAAARRACRARRAFRREAGDARLGRGSGPRSRGSTGCLREPHAAFSPGGDARRSGDETGRRRRLARAGRAHGRGAGCRACRHLQSAARLAVTAEDAVPLLRQLLDERAVRPPYGGHPRISIWGLLEARLQRADLLVLGGLNEGVLAGASCTRSVASAEGPRDARNAHARVPHRPCGA